MQTLKITKWSTVLVNGFFLALLNLSVITVIGYLTLDSEANLNSRLGGILASFFIPYFIVTKTRQMNGLERMLKFGAGFVLYIISSLVMVGFPMAFQFCLLPCLVIGLATLYYGDRLA
jgi:hypothetical protein